MRDESILEAISELDRWRERQAELRDELEKAARQVSYYEALVRDMKREVGAPRVRDFLRGMSP